MRRSRWATARALAVFAVCACAALMVVALPAVAVPASAPAAEPALPAYKQDALQATLTAQMAKYNVPGAIVGMWFPGAGTWVTGAGTGDLTTADAPDPAEAPA